MSASVADFVGVSARRMSGFWPPRRWRRANGFDSRRPSPNSHRTNARMQRIEVPTVLSERGVVDAATARATASGSPRHTPRAAGFAFRCATYARSVGKSSEAVVAGLPSAAIQARKLRNSDV